MYPYRLGYRTFPLTGNGIFVPASDLGTSAAGNSTTTEARRAGLYGLLVEVPDPEEDDTITFHDLERAQVSSGGALVGPNPVAVLRPSWAAGVAGSPDIFSAASRMIHLPIAFDRGLVIVAAIATAEVRVLYHPAGQQLKRHPGA